MMKRRTRMTRKVSKKSKKPEGLAWVMVAEVKKTSLTRLSTKSNSKG